MSIKAFLVKLLFYSVLVYLINLGIGEFFKNDNSKKTQLGIFYPETRWNEFYSLPEKSLDLVFLGSSLCYRGINPELVDSLTHLKSFNLGSSIQSLTTTYFVFEELLNHQHPKVIYLDLFTRTLNLEDQLESVRYNYEFMNSGEAKDNLYLSGLNFTEKIQFLFPAFYKRDQLNSIFKYAFKSIDTSKISDKYYKKGFVKSSKRMSTASLNLKLNGLTKFDWTPTERTEIHLKYLQKIIDRCKDENIKLILSSTPIPKSFYKIIELEQFEKTIQDISRKNNLEFINYNKTGLPLNDTLHFKDHHLNQYGARILSTKIAEQINNSK